MDNELEPSRPVEKHVALQSGQILDFDGGVKLRYSKTHPLSSTARIDFVSRHRTQPWSDAILLAGHIHHSRPQPKQSCLLPDLER